MAEKILLALSTFPDAEIARRISNELVSQRFAACANILPTLESIYRWKGNVESGQESLVFFKVGENRRAAFQDRLRALHPYDVPEIIFLVIESGIPEYLHWVSENCGQTL
jgi:periplasmic divalent cation tolerance protein